MRLSPRFGLWPQLAVLAGAALLPATSDDQDAQPADDQQRALAEHLSFLLEGATVRAGLEGTLEPMRRARELAATVVEHRPGTGR